jgi:CRISPR-associated protein Csd2
LNKLYKRESADIKAYLLKRFFDVRTFGAVVNTKEFNAGQIRGSVQLCFSRSVDKILPVSVGITRSVATTEKNKAKKGEDEDLHDSGKMGRKYIVPYGLYRLNGFVSANYAKQTGFTEADLELFWDALRNMFDQDHSAARGCMSARKLFVFKHESHLGNAPAVALFDKITAVQVDKSNPPRNFSDYEISAGGNMPQGVEKLELL